LIDNIEVEGQVLVQMESSIKAVIKQNGKMVENKSL
jgi:hypothetical protein